MIRQRLVGIIAVTVACTNNNPDVDGGVDAALDTTSTGVGPLS